MNSLLLALILSAAPARAEEAAAPAKLWWSDVSKWLGDLKAALADSAVRRHQRQFRGAVAVAAVRGDRQSLEDPDKPYWKGTAASKQERAERQERGELAKAVELAIAGKAEDALKALDAFETAHPDSVVLADCRQAREKIKAAADVPAMPGAAAAKAEAAAGGKSEPVKADEEKP